MTLIAMPIILFTILSFALQGSFSSGSGDVWDIQIGLVKAYDFDEDYKAIEDFVTKEQALEVDNIVPNIFDSPGLEFVNYQWMTYEEGIQGLEDNVLTSVLVIPKSYIKDVIMNMSPMAIEEIEFQVINHPDKAYGSSIINKIVSELSENLSTQMIHRKVVQEVLSEEKVSPFRI